MFYLLALGQPAQKDSQPAPAATNPLIGVKRRNVSNPTTNPIAVVTVKPAPKRPRPAASASTLSNVIVDLISSDDEVVFVSSNTSQKSSLNSTKPKIAKQRDVILLCPLSTPNKPCIRCKVVQILKGKLFSCHCGAAPVTLCRGQVEGARAHWSSGACKDATSGLRGNQMLTSYFKKYPALQPDNKNLVDTVCPGLTDATWVRKQATGTILNFLDNTYSIY
ncbi:uncharacterized protein MELLADRAFT_92366 [Melampsora larici-populina 98AG31]|uniref:Uncharacterized protein n=1 Tax=Melampsora larici-populina (strain 98AG31 / pathotype 3-4-7) TaxID=747676 RepID=F4R9D2_MELLP|nr:uncharacterized protein MELLADRAFT_92366 [Melampsora larici-populina 98AG31]EGG10965.1 hypothetical protein MELLADRAFT_92366 [Melampsora larici-populina 98AG31]